MFLHVVVVFQATDKFDETSVWHFGYIENISHTSTHRSDLLVKPQSQTISDSMAIR
jgi:hypothetical protein